MVMVNWYIWSISTLFISKMPHSNYWYRLFLDKNIKTVLCVTRLNNAKQSVDAVLKTSFRFAIQCQLLEQCSTWLGWRIHSRVRTMLPVTLLNKQTMVRVVFYVTRLNNTKQSFGADLSITMLNNINPTDKAVHAPTRLDNTRPIVRAVFYPTRWSNTKLSVGAVLSTNLYIYIFIRCYTVEQQNGNC